MKIKLQVQNKVSEGSFLFLFLSAGRRGWSLEGLHRSISASQGPRGNAVAGFG